MKRLEEERKSLCVELGLGDEHARVAAGAPPTPTAAAAQTSVAVALAAGARGAAPSAQAAREEPRGFEVAFKCLGFLFSFSVKPAAAAANSLAGS